MAVLVLLLAVVVALLGVVVAGLLRSHAEILRSLHDAGIGLDPAPHASAASGAPLPTRPEPRVASDLVGVSPAGDPLRVPVVGVEHPTVVAFLTSTCTTCAGFWAAFANPRRRRLPDGARLVVVTKGPESDNAARIATLAPPDVPVVMSTAAWEAFDVRVGPRVVWVDGARGVIVGEGAATTWEQSRTMLEAALADAGATSRRRGHRLVGRWGRAPTR